MNYSKPQIQVTTSLMGNGIPRSDANDSVIGRKCNYRICHLSKYYPPMRGGIETHVQTLARAQADLGVEVDVFCVNGFDQRGEPSLRTKTIEEEMDGNVRVTRFGRLLSCARFDLCPELHKGIDKLVNESNTIIHLHTPNPTMLIALLMFGQRVPIIITHHSDIIKQQILKYALRPIEYIIYSQASQILATSSQYIEGSKFLGHYKNKLDSLPLGLDCSKYMRPDKASLNYAESLKQKYDTPIWLIVGRIVYYKAIHIAIEALKLVPGTLIIIGTGSLETELKEQASQLGLEDRIVWHGKASEQELIGAYHAATALWFPSNVRSEGFGLVQLEAMASGCPAINANISCSGVPWVSRHEQEGLTVPINDSTAFAKAAERILYEPGLRHRLAQASRKRALDFDHINMAKQSLEIYQKVLTNEYPDFCSSG